MDHLQTLKVRFELLTAHYRDVSQQNRAVAMAGGRPSEADLQRESEAEEAMAAAREAYLQALAGPAG